MFKREISSEEVISAVKNGKNIKEYTDDKPYPSFLSLHFINQKVIHVVFSIDNNNDCIVITAYEPDENI
jgi:hypothetical protein